MGDDELLVLCLTPNPQRPERLQALSAMGAQLAVLPTIPREDFGSESTYCDFCGDYTIIDAIPIWRASRKILEEVERVLDYPLR